MPSEPLEADVQALIKRAKTALGADTCMWVGIDGLSPKTVGQAALELRQQGYHCSLPVNSDETVYENGSLWLIATSPY